MTVVVQILCCSLIAVALTTVSPARAENESDDVWEFRAAPYIWIPAMTGDVTVNGTETDIDTSVSDVFTTSDFAFALQGQFEAWHRSGWGAFVNGQWAVLKDNDNLNGTPLEFDLKMNSGIFEAGGFYSFGERPFGAESDSATWTLEPLFGARLTVIKVTFDFDNFSDDDDTETFVDPFLGARARFRFGPENRWNWTLRGDIGGFGVGSDFTWNAIGLLGYDFHIGSMPSTVTFGGRALSQDYEDGSGSSEFRWDVIQYGPLAALEIKF